MGFVNFSVTEKSVLCKHGEEFLGVGGIEIVGKNSPVHTSTLIVFNYLTLESAFTRLITFLEHGLCIFLSVYITSLQLLFVNQQAACVILHSPKCSGVQKSKMITNVLLSNIVLWVNVIAFSFKSSVIFSMLYIFVCIPGFLKSKIKSVHTVYFRDIKGLPERPGLLDHQVYQ